MYIALLCFVHFLCIIKLYKEVNDVVSKFSMRLKELRQSRDMSMHDLAKQIGMSKSSVNMYERGEREPGLETLEAIADCFNVDLDYLLGKSDIPNRALTQSYKIPTIPPPSEVDPDLFILHMYKKLDDIDKAEIRGEMKQMLKAKKYTPTAPAANKGVRISLAARNGKSDVIELTPEEAEIAKQKFPQYFD